MYEGNYLVLHACLYTNAVQLHIIQYIIFILYCRGFDWLGILAYSWGCTEVGEKSRTKNIKAIVCQELRVDRQNAKRSARRLQFPVDESDHPANTPSEVPSATVDPMITPSEVPSLSA
jgi:hypothetical protein